MDSSASHYVEIGIGGGAIHVALVAEYICGTPKVLDVGTLHLLQGIVGDSFHASFIFLDGIALVNEVNVVEAEVLNAQFLHDLEASVHLVLGALYGILCLVPLIGASLATELVGRSLAQRVPPCHGELQPIFHLLAHYDLLGVIIVECHRVLAFSSLEGNLTNLWKILFCHNTKIF